MCSSLSSGHERTIKTENNFEYSRPHGYCSDTLFLSSSIEHALFSLKEEMLGVSETLTKVCGETAGHRNGVQSRWNKPSALCVNRNTVFVSDTGNKAVRILTSAKGLIPLQSKTAQYANVFRLDNKANEEDLPRTFEDHVKSVEELVAFLSNHEQEALERTGKRNTNGSDMTIPRCTRKSFIADHPYQHGNGDRA